MEKDKLYYDENQPGIYMREIDLFIPPYKNILKQSLHEMFQWNINQQTAKGIDRADIILLSGDELKGHLNHFFKIPINVEEKEYGYDVIANIGTKTIIIECNIK